jgi:hypothetical protein
MLVHPIRHGMVYRMHREVGLNIESIAVERKHKMKLTAWDAHQAGKLSLPPGYYVELGADLIELHGPDGSLVAVFSARGATPAQVARVAEEEYRKNGESNV